MRNGAPDNFDATTDSFATNTWGALHGHFNFGAMVLVEIVLTAVLVFVVLSTTKKDFAPGASGLTVGMTLVMIHLISIPVDNTSVNPARSFGMALFAGGDSVEQLWAFFLFPIIGAIVGVLIYLALNDADLEDSLLDVGPLSAGRDALTAVGNRVDAGVGAVGSMVSGDQPADGSGTIASLRSDDGPEAVSSLRRSEDAPDAPTVDERPYGDGSMAPLPDNSMPEGYPIKGNVDSMLYHRTDSRNYGATVAEVWFDTPENAEAGGFTLANTHPN